MSKIYSLYRKSVTYTLLLRTKLLILIVAQIAYPYFVKHSPASKN